MPSFHLQSPSGVVPMTCPLQAAITTASIWPFSKLRSQDKGGAVSASPTATPAGHASRNQGEPHCSEVTLSSHSSLQPQFLPTCHSPPTATVMTSILEGQSTRKMQGSPHLHLCLWWTEVRLPKTRIHGASLVRAVAHMVPRLIWRSR